MWYPADFKQLEDLHFEAAEDYAANHPNKKLAQTLFVGTHNLHDWIMEMHAMARDYTGDQHELQLIYLARGTPALFSVYWLTKHHYYPGAYSRIRFILELYLVIRELNRDKESTERKWQELKKDLIETEYARHDTIPTTEYFSGKRRQVKHDELSDLERSFYNKISNIGSHPNSIQSSRWDGEYSKQIEQDILKSGLAFLFGLTAQYVRTFENTEIAREVREDLDGIFVQILLAESSLPTFLREDLEFGLHTE